MKLFFYIFRTFDEKEFADKYSYEYGIEYGYTEKAPGLDTIELARGYEAISTNPCDMSEPIVRALHDVGAKYLVCRSIGYDHINLPTAKELGLKVSHASYPPSIVANYAIMLMMMSLRKMNEIMGRALIQDYSLPGKIGTDISFTTVGIIGTGKIGTTVIRHLSGFGCKILCFDPYENDEAKKYATYVDLDTLFQESDVISLHTNATEENYHLIDEKAFSKMKDGVVIVNTARGSLIDTDALIYAILKKKVGAAGLDVIEHENGLYYNNKVSDVINNTHLALLKSFPNVTITPHTAFYTRNAVENMVKSAFDAAIAFDEGREYPFEVKL